MNKLKVSCLALVAGVSFVANGYAVEPYAFQADVDELRSDVEILQRQVYRSQSEAPAGKSSDVMVRMSDFEEQLRQMNGKIEEVNYKIKQLNDRMDMINKDIDVRFKMIEGKPLNGGAGTQAKNKKFDAPVANNAPKSLVGDSIKGGDLAPVEAPKPVLEQDVNKIYQQGLEAYNAGQYDKAEASFSDILNRFSQDKLAANAQYWLGEVYYSQKNYAKAAVAFGKGYEKYKDGAKGAESLYKLGMAMNQLGKKEEACAALTNVAKEFPKAEKTLLDKAKNEASKLKCK